MKRIEATNFALSNDDGSILKHYDMADIILIGVSRSGKTPTCLYLAMQYGIYAANFPLTEFELEDGLIPKSFNWDKNFSVADLPSSSVMSLISKLGFFEHN